MSNFQRYTITAPAAGSTVEIDVYCRYIAVEESVYTSGATCNTIKLNSSLSSPLPAMGGSEYSSSNLVTKLIITGGTDGGEIVLMTHPNPCSGYFTPGFKLHPLANVAGLTPVFIFDANFSFRSYPVGVDISRLPDTSGNENHFEYASGGHARKIAGGAASGDAHTINLPNEDTAYNAASDLIPTPNAAGVFLHMIVALNAGTVSGVTTNYQIYGQGQADDSACFRVMQDTNEAYQNIHGAKVARDLSRTWVNSFNIASFANYYSGGNQGAAVRWNSESVAENDWPVGGGLLNWQTGAVSQIGGNALNAKGIGNPGCRLAFIGAWLYSDPNYSHEPLNYVADVYGKTLV